MRVLRNTWLDRPSVEKQGRGPDTRSGSVMIFLIMTLVVLVFVVLWNTDLERILHVKSLAQDAGDSSALMAARWQGVSLNLVGDLNILQALAVAADDQATVDAVSNLQARICLTGPMIAFAAAQQAAKNNNIYVNPAFTQLVAEHAVTVRDEYTRIVGSTGEMLFPEPYLGAWDDYADMLETIADNGVAAGPDNARFYGDYGANQTLLNVGFYEAIAGQSWCWFFNNAPDLLEAYDDYHWWPALPVQVFPHYGNSEIFSLGLDPFATRLTGHVPLATLEKTADDRGMTPPPLDAAMVTQAVWYAYTPGRWSGWGSMTDGSLPLTGELKPQYDYIGADAVVRVEAQTHRLTPGAHGSESTNTLIWTAAAKPFGSLEDSNGPIRPNSYDLVLPAFTDVRLIPLDASTAPSGGAFNYAWQLHIREHLPDYMDNGPGRFSCWYCNQLVTWENPAFRYAGVLWLEDNSWRCTIVPSGGGGGGGGTRHGH
jgi:hypothetical protein